MLENAIVQISLEDFNILREESNQFRLLKRQMGSCCNIDYSEGKGNVSKEEMSIEVNSVKMGDIIKKYAVINPTAENKSTIEADKRAELMFAKVVYK